MSIKPMVSFCLPSIMKFKNGLVFIIIFLKLMRVKRLITLS